MKKYISINTDDFGLSPGINKGIVEAFKAGTLTDASLLANAPAFNEAVNLAKEFKIPISAHINLIRGKMLTNFDSPESIVSLWKKSLSKKYLLKIEKEVRAQIERILNQDLEIYQINSEKHSHFFPVIFKLMLKLSDEYNIKYIRFIREFNLKFKIQGLKANLLSIFSLKNKRMLNNFSTKTSDYFMGIIYTGNFNKSTLFKIIQKIKCGWTEMMVHIGYNDKIDRSMGDYFLGKEREEELAALLDPEFKVIISQSKVKLKSFGG